MIIAPLAEKGGTGKTTLATNLAGMRAAAGRRAQIVDADRQGSSRFWAQTRSSLRLPRLGSIPLYGEAFSRQIAAVASRYDDVVIRHRRGRRLRDGHRPQSGGLRTRSTSANGRGGVDDGTGGRPRGRHSFPKP